MPSQDLGRLRHPTRRRILDAAERLFASQGFESATVDDIAAAAGVSKSHLYYHFPAKTSLLEGLIRLRTSELLADKAALLDGQGPALGCDSSELSETLTKAITDVLAPRRDFIRVVLVEAIRNPGATRPVFEAVTATLDDVAARLDAAGHTVAEGERDAWLFLGILPALYLVALTEPEDLSIKARSLGSELGRWESAYLAGGPGIQSDHS
ncbi:MAG: TetR/AcrR family transcriptional regulator [Propionibacteriaceae bacterium]|nr:TetR/AcrR family transcriptional regulator [Micropruina sp.]HBX80916.1 hypothetical protein [Propionibacteriaceae bacterium]HBY22581.1 hypothetical protein [Propionibacteriaceae bacterium]